MDPQNQRALVTGATSGIVRATHRGSSALVLLCVAQFVLQLDFSIVNIALQTIQGELGFSDAGLQWVATSYALTFGSLLLLGGRLGDRVGRRRLLIAGLWLFGAASLACGLAPTAGTLVAARFVQGIGAALMAPTILSTLTALYAEGPARARALGLWTAATAAGGTTGIVAGGVLTQLLGWRSIFLVNLPVIAVLLVAMPRVLPDVRADHARRLDPIGATLATVSIGALILGLSSGEQRGFGSPLAVAALAASAVLAVAFWLAERTVADPMVPFSFLAVPLRRTSALAMVVVGGVFAAYAYTTALYLQRVLGYSEILAGLAIVPAPLTLVATSTRLTRVLIARLGLATVLVSGMVALALGQLWLSRIGAHSDYATAILPGLVLTAFGGGLAFPAMSIGITAGVTADEQGLAGGLIPTAQQVGAAVGLAVLATIAAATSRHHGGALVDGYRMAFRVAGGLAALTAVAAAVSARRAVRRSGIRTAEL